MQGGGGAAVVELDEDVVGDQGDGPVRVEGRLEAGQPQGEVELVGGPEAQAADADGLGAPGRTAWSRGWS